MFTIKVIKPMTNGEEGLSGEQQLYEVEWVAYHPADKPGSSETVEFKKSLDPSSYLVTDGDIYVMNESGKTVADYHLTSYRPILSAHDLP
jgi:hypothetical protein